MNMQNALVQEQVVELDDFPASKRVFDFLGAVLGLILASPLYLIVAVLILITEGRPIVFRQARLGRGGEMFYIWKFRSMCHNAEEILRSHPKAYEKYVENNYKLPEGEDPRITRLGHFLRNTSLDEIPQFWNVIRGEMSLVGPRPIVYEELEEYGNKKGLFLKMKPGVTGIWQVSGRSDLQYPERARLELSYLDKQGFWFDVKTIFKTVYCVLMRVGAH